MAWLSLALGLVVGFAIGALISSAAVYLVFAGRRDENADTIDPTFAEWRPQLEERP